MGKTQDLDLETDPLQTITRMPTQDSSLAMELLMLVLLELPLELLANMLQTIFNPCTRGGTRKQNTNNRIFGGNTGNFLFGAIAGFAGASIANAAAGSPCGR